MSEAYPDGSGYDRAAADPRDASVGDLLSQVTSDLSLLFRQEVELAKVEVKEEVSKAGKSAGMLGGAGGAGYFALLFLSLAIMFGLGEVMALGWAALIVGVLYAAAAAVLFLRGRAGLKSVSPAPTQTVDTIKEDVQWAKTRSR